MTVAQLSRGCDIVSPATYVGNHHHLWIVREVLHTELGNYQSWFECEVCGEHYP